MAAARAAEPGAQLDVAFIAYFEAYQEYLTLMQELQSVNGEGHISLARARNNLSRSRNTLSPCIGTLQFPRKMRANWRIESKEEEAGMPSEDATSSAASAPPVLQLRLTRPDPTSDDPISAEAEASSKTGLGIAAKLDGGDTAVLKEKDVPKARRYLLLNHQYLEGFLGPIYSTLPIFIF